MNEESLADKIRELTPKLVNNRLTTRNKRLRQFNYEIERKFGLSKYWGYTYPDYGSTENPEKHYRNCVDALNSMESKLRKFSSGFQVELNEKTEVPLEKPWTEEVTLPLFEDSYRKGFLAHFLSPFKQFTGGLLKLLHQEHKDFCQRMNSFSGLYGDYNPKTEQLIILKSKEGGEILFSVSPNRHFRNYSEKTSLEFCDGMILGYQHLPVLLRFRGFDSGNRAFRELHEELATTDFSPIKREFPFVPRQSDINWDKFSNLIHEYAERGEYAKSYGARRIVEDALKKRIITFEEAKRLLPRLLNGEIVFENQVIKDLCSKLKES